MKASRTVFFYALLGIAIAGGPAILAAQDHDMMQGMSGMDHGKPAGDTGPSSLAYRGANDKMHADMAIVYTGDADVDFVKGMIPHHQGAIDMAKIVIAFGDDPEIRKLAEEIVEAQEGEIALMQAWLTKHAQ